MGSWFSCECASIYNYSLATKTLDWRRESSFCGVYYRHGPVPYGVKVVRNAKEQDEDEDEDQELRMDTNFDCYCSATTTALTLLKRGEYLITTQIGNSGAILGTRDENNALIPVHLTVNLKPHPLPAARKCQVEPEVDKDPPKLSAPFISHRRITDADEFVVLATGGVWEVLTKKDVINIVGTCPGRWSAARAVVDAAVTKWRYKYPTSMVDDCAVVCLFLNSSTRHPSPQPHVVTNKKTNRINILPLGKKKRD